MTFIDLSRCKQCNGSIGQGQRSLLAPPPREEQFRGVLLGSRLRTPDVQRLSVPAYPLLPVHSDIICM